MKKTQRIKKLEEENENLVKALNGETFINYKIPMENATLKRQLQELPKKICDEIKKELLQPFDTSIIRGVTIREVIDEIQAKYEKRIH